MEGTAEPRRWHVHTQSLGLLQSVLVVFHFLCSQFKLNVIGVLIYLVFAKCTGICLKFQLIIGVLFVIVGALGINTMYHGKLAYKYIFFSFNLNSPMCNLCCNINTIKAAVFQLE